MVSDILKAWPEEYGIAFALGMCSGKIHGKVRLNKAMALLQRDGFPIPNKFKNAKMGPHDANIAAKALEMKKDHLLDISEEETTYENSRITYVLKDAGKKLLFSEFEQHFGSMSQEPYYLALLENFEETKNRVLTLKTTKLVEDVHKELYLDNIGLFDTQLVEVRKDLANEMEYLQRLGRESCPICLETLGSIDFTIRALEAIHDPDEAVGHWRRFAYREYSGKSFILFNALKLLEYSKGIRGHPHILDARLDKEAPQTMSRSRILLRLHSIEFIGERYGIISPFVVETNEMDACVNIRA
jgi:hypothetical protein